MPPAFSGAFKTAKALGLELPIALLAVPTK
jgi:hypothetical protein